MLTRCSVRLKILKGILVTGELEMLKNMMAWSHQSLQATWDSAASSTIAEDVQRPACLEVKR